MFVCPVPKISHVPYEMVPPSFTLYMVDLLCGTTAEETFDTLSLCTVNSTSSPATKLTSVHSVKKLAESARPPQHTTT